MKNDELDSYKYKKIRIIIQSILIVLILSILIFGIIKLYPVFMRIKNDELYRDMIVNKISSLGGISWIILILIQIVQTILAIIPAGPVVMITGMIYSPIIATTICLIGQTLGAIVVIYLVKIFGYSFISLFIDPEKTKKFKILNDGKRCAVLMFSYLLIPLLPKDPISFIIPFTKVKIRDFIWINLIARAPMTIVTVYFGNSLMTGEYFIAILLGSICTIIAILCFIFNKKIVNFIDNISVKNT